MAQWFRYYDDALHDPKVQRLTGEAFKGWVNVLCLASVNGGKVPSTGDVAFGLRVTPARAQALLTELETAGLLDRVDGELEPHNWSHRQFKSDTSNARVAAYRQRKSADKESYKTVTGNSPGNVTAPVTGNGKLTTQNRTESEQKEKKDSVGPKVGPTASVADLAHDFEQFWRSYPRTPNMSKKEALSAWCKLTSSDREAVLIAGPKYARWLTSERAKRPDAPAVHAVRFITQRRFEGFNEPPDPTTAERPKMKHGEVMPASAGRLAGYFYVAAGTPEWSAWCDYFKKSGRVSPESYERFGGWTFPTLSPPV